MRSDEEKKRTRGRAAHRRDGHSGASVPDQHRIGAGEFKARCLGLMDRVRETGEEYVITKRGRPVAKLTPITDRDLRPFVGRSRGVIRATRDDLLAPLDPDWDVDADL